MSSGSRRQKIVEVLKDRGEPVTGSDLAASLGVSRQVIVQDIALLRARGEKILSTPRGYLLAGKVIPGLATRVIACKHTREQLADELHTIVAHGGRIIDVIVEHPLYGELRGMLMIESHKDVEEFDRALTESAAKPLSALTEGMHLHTVQAASEAALDGVEAALEAKGYLLSE
ncbi:MAG TPA: transcription repressor NadR [Firmicutes bacterium]|nr:transcription repressor NadR [Bacillota bacterium]HHY98344.1 transcription repressor NadR [Bacillota bacterium]